MNAKAKILVIDDEELVRAVISRILSREGYTVVEATNGRAGLETFYRETPDVVVTDIIMPDQEGIEVICELKRASPTTKILAISGGGQWHQIDYCLKAAKQLGAEATLRKPFSRDELLAQIHFLLRPTEDFSTDRNVGDRTEPDGAGEERKFL